MPRSPSSLVVHYAEIGTKGNNRAYFENSLERNIREKLSLAGEFEVDLVDQRLIIRGAEPSLGRAVPVLRDVFGVAWFARVYECPLEYAAAKALALEVMEGQRLSGRSSFRVTCRRANKSFEMSSQEMAVRLGEDVMKAGFKVDLSNPQVTLFVDILSDRILVHTEKERGPGGLPVGATGKVVHLLSGGIDSPVAAWLMMKRGCDLTYAHFFVAPSAEEIALSKMSALLKTLARFGTGGARMVLIPFTEYQVATADLRPDYEPVVFRHFMRMVAEKVALRVGAAAISTGDNLGQVASQTLFNIACIDAGAAMPVLRPVVGYDKTEIIALAQSIGTYDDSISEYKDCCSIVSRHPKTRMSVEAVLEASRRYDFASLAQATLAGSSLMKLDGTTGAIRVEPMEEVPRLEGRP